MKKIILSLFLAIISGVVVANDAPAGAGAGGASEETVGKKKKKKDAAEQANPKLTALRTAVESFSASDSNKKMAEAVFTALNKVPTKTKNKADFFAYVKDIPCLVTLKLFELFPGTECVELNAFLKSFNFARLTTIQLFTVYRFLLAPIIDDKRLYPIVSCPGRELEYKAPILPVLLKCLPVLEQKCPPSTDKVNLLLNLLSNKFTFYNGYTTQPIRATDIKWSDLVSLCQCLIDPAAKRRFTTPDFLQDFLFYGMELKYADSRGGRNISANESGGEFDFSPVRKFDQFMLWIGNDQLRAELINFVSMNRNSFEIDFKDPTSRDKNSAFGILYDSLPRFLQQIKRASLSALQKESVSSFVTEFLLRDPYAQCVGTPPSFGDLQARKELLGGWLDLVISFGYDFEEARKNINAVITKAPESMMEWFLLSKQMAPRDVLGAITDDVFRQEIRHGRIKLNLETVSSEWSDIKSNYSPEEIKKFKDLVWTRLVAKLKKSSDSAALLSSLPEDLQDGAEVLAAIKEASVDQLYSYGDGDDKDSKEQSIIEAVFLLDESALTPKRLAVKKRFNQILSASLLKYENRKGLAYYWLLLKKDKGSDRSKLEAFTKQLFFYCGEEQLRPGYSFVQIALFFGDLLFESDWRKHRPDRNDRDLVALVNKLFEPTLNGLFFQIEQAFDDAVGQRAFSVPSFTINETVGFDLSFLTVSCKYIKDRVDDDRLKDLEFKFRFLSRFPLGYFNRCTQKQINGGVRLALSSIADSRVPQASFEDVLSEYTKWSHLFVAESEAPPVAPVSHHSIPTREDLRRFESDSDEGGEPPVGPVVPHTEHVHLGGGDTPEPFRVISKPAVPAAISKSASPATPATKNNLMPTVGGAVAGGGLGLALTALILKNKLSMLEARKANLISKQLSTVALDRQIKRHKAAFAKILGAVGLVAAGIGGSAGYVASRGWLSRR